MAPNLRAARVAAPVQVLEWNQVSMDARGREQTLTHHPTDNQGLVWVRSGSGEHRIDGEAVDVIPGTVTLVGREPVHLLFRAQNVTGTVVRFGEEFLYGGGSEYTNPAWLFAGRGRRSVPVPIGDVATLESTIATLRSETTRSVDWCNVDLQRHLLVVLLLWTERWYDAALIERRGAGEADVGLQRRFQILLERDFSRSHDAGHYADELGIPPAALSRALSRIEGHSTKELILDRVMIEAARLLRFTDLTIGQIAHRTGFSDPLYFSRAFKRHHGLAPVRFRGVSRGAHE